MKRQFLAAITIGAVLATSGCSSAADTAENTAAVRTAGENMNEGDTVPERVHSSEEDGTTQTEESGAGLNGDVLVAYFSWAEKGILEDEVGADAARSMVPEGDVQQLAGWVQEETGGDLFSIRVTEPYPSDWDECLERANEERSENARPELEERIENLDEYDTVFLGYPNWWYGVPMPLLTFLE